jgi:hypothetical protein
LHAFVPCRFLHRGTPFTHDFVDWAEEERCHYCRK